MKLKMKLQVSNVVFIAGLIVEVVPEFIGETIPNHSQHSNLLFKWVDSYFIWNLISKSIILVKEKILNSK